MAEDPEAALRGARARFMGAFAEQVTSAGVLAATAADPRTSKPLHHIVHQMAGLAGTVGFPTVSERALELEQLLSARSDINVGTTWVRACLDMLTPAFADDQQHAPPWALVGATPHAVKILIAEDDPVQGTVIAAWLEQAGYATVVVASGDQVLPVAKIERPGLILLDIGLPVVDGYQVFWDMQASIEVAGIPVMLMTAGVGLDNRLTGLTAGAADYLEKPLEERELLVRVGRLLHQSAAAAPRSMVLEHDAFEIAASDLLRTGEAAIAIVHLPSRRQDDVLASLVGDLRKCDLVGRYDQDHLVLAMPGLEPAVACVRLRDTIASLHGWAPSGLAAGVARTSAEGEHRIAPLIAEAREALNDAHHRNETAAVRVDAVSPRPGRRYTVVLADDDLQIVHIVAPRMRAAGYHTVLAFDGQQAIDAVRAHNADLLLIDLTMPKVSGFEVLERVRHLTRPPIAIVLSGHRNSDDVCRVGTLGARDYILKPFDPADLMARVARLLGSTKATTR